MQTSSAVLIVTFYTCQQQQFESLSAEAGSARSYTMAGDCSSIGMWLYPLGGYWSHFHVDDSTQEAAIRRNLFPKPSGSCRCTPGDGQHAESTTRRASNLRNVDKVTKTDVDKGALILSE